MNTPTEIKLSYPQLIPTILPLSVMNPMTWWTMMTSQRWIWRFRWLTKSSSMRATSSQATQGKKNKAERKTIREMKQKKIQVKFKENRQERKN